MTRLSSVSLMLAKTPKAPQSFSLKPSAELSTNAAELTSYELARCLRRQRYLSGPAGVTILLAKMLSLTKSLHPKFAASLQLSSA